MTRCFFRVGAILRCLLLPAIGLAAENTACAQDWTSPAAVNEYAKDRKREGAMVAAQRPWIWKVEGGRAKIWIVGCMHLGLPTDQAVFDPYLSAYRQAQEVFFETRPAAWNSIEARTLLGRRGYLDYRESLSAKVSRETWDQFKASLRGDPARLKSLSVMEPWMAGFTFLQEQYAALGLTREHSLETAIERLAGRDRKLVGGLEIPADQILALADAPAVDQEAFLKAAIRLPAANNRQTLALRAAWLSGNEAQLKAALGFTGDSVASVIDQRLIGQRNQRWVASIREIEGRGKDSLIMVGVEHLVTPHQPLLAALQSQGLSARRITDRSATVAPPPPERSRFLKPFLRDREPLVQ